MHSIFGSAKLSPNHLLIQQSCAYVRDQRFEDDF